MRFGHDRGPLVGVDVERLFSQRKNGLEIRLLLNICMSTEKESRETQNVFPKAIVHIDGDAFFAGCELAARPWLKGKPVVVGAERGIATAFSYEAKAMGIHRGMSMFEIRKKYPQAIVLPSNYLHYRMYSNRMFQIVSRYSNKVEHYSVDECFADITGMDKVFGIPYEEIARKMKRDLDVELGTTFSLGLSITKVLAKCASKYRKPSGFSIIRKNETEKFLKDMSIGKVWGIGTQSSISLTRQKIFTAYDLASKDENWIRDRYSKPLQEIHAELNGVHLFEVNESHDIQKSVMSTGTFHPFSSDLEMVFSELSTHIEEVCFRMRRMGLTAKYFSFFIKSKDFRYSGGSVDLPTETSYPEVVVAEARKIFVNLFNPHEVYRATGASVHGLKPMDLKTFSLFEEKVEEKREGLYPAIDLIEAKYGAKGIFLGSSFRAMRKWESRKRVLNIPSLGEVR